MKVILSLVSNVHQDSNIGKARKMLECLFHDIRFSDSIWTQPIGLDSDLFLNCLAVAHTDKPLETIRKEMKRIEMELGDSSHIHGVVNIDVDILQYGDYRYKHSDWQRDYVKTLMCQLEKT